MNIIRTKLTEKQFTNASMVVLSKKPVAWLFPIIGFFLIVINMSSPSNAGSLTTYIVPVAYLIIFGGMLPLVTYFKARTMYRAANSRAKENIEYEFQDTHFIIRGESFNANFSWDKVQKVTETKNWLFIWFNSQAANPIPKEAIWEGELMKLKEILNANKVKNNLK